MKDNLEKMLKLTYDRLIDNIKDKDGFANSYFYTFIFNLLNFDSHNYRQIGFDSLKNKVEVISSFRIIKVKQEKDYSKITVRIRDNRYLGVYADKPSYEIPEYGHIYQVGDKELNVKKVEFKHLEAVDLYVDKVIGIRELKGKWIRFSGRFAVLM